MAALTDAHHAALERLDALEAELRRSSFTVEIADRLRAAIDVVENAMRGLAVPTSGKVTPDVSDATVPPDKTDAI